MKKVIAKGHYPDYITCENLFDFHADDISLFGKMRLRYKLFQDIRKYQHLQL